MASTGLRSRKAWALTASQDDVITWDQLRGLGFSRNAIAHRLATGRLHRLWPGVYAVGRPNLPRRGWWRAAVLACGPDAVLSHDSAAARHGIRAELTSLIHVSIPEHRRRLLHGIRVHRRSNLQPWEVGLDAGIPVTCPVTTLVDIARGLTVAQLERAINEADTRGLVDPEALRATLEMLPARPGVGKLRRLLDRHSFVLTDSELERRFVPLALHAGLGLPVTQADLNGFRVDFFWPGLGLVVETDGLRYHRTPAAQARDRLRDQAHAAAGLTPLRFTHAQIRYEPARVEAILRSVANRLRRGAEAIGA